MFTARYAFTTAAAPGVVTDDGDGSAQGVTASPPADTTSQGLFVGAVGYPTDPVARVNPTVRTPDLTRYIGLTVGPPAGTRWTPGRITFNAARGGGATPRYLRPSVDGAWLADLVELPTVRPSWSSFTVDLSGLGERATPLEVRLHPGSPSTSSTVEFDDVVVSGAVAAPKVGTSKGTALSRARAAATASRTSVFTGAADARADARASTTSTRATAAAASASATTTATSTRDGVSTGMSPAHATAAAWAGGDHASTGTAPARATATSAVTASGRSAGTASAQAGATATSRSQRDSTATARAVVTATATGATTRACSSAARAQAATSATTTSHRATTGTAAVTATATTTRRRTTATTPDPSGVGRRPARIGRPRIFDNPRRHPTAGWQAGWDTAPPGRGLIPARLPARVGGT